MIFQNESCTVVYTLRIYYYYISAYIMSPHILYVITIIVHISLWRSFRKLRRPTYLDDMRRCMSSRRGGNIIASAIYYFWTSASTRARVSSTLWEKNVVTSSSFHRVRTNRHAHVKSGSNIFIIVSSYASLKKKEKKSTDQSKLQHFRFTSTFRLLRPITI